MSNVTAYATQLSQALVQTPEYQNVVQQYSALKNDPNSYQLFKQIQGYQEQLQQKMASGGQVSQQEQQQLQQMMMYAQQNPRIMGLMQAEQQLNSLIQSINTTIMAPLDKLYKS